MSTFNMTTTDAMNIQSVFAVCGAANIDSVMITDNKIRGISANTKIAIITETDFSFDSKIRLGIGRLSELDKRLKIFSGVVAIEGKTNDSGEVSILTLKSGRSSIQYRCTAEKLIRYPKSNEDEPIGLLSITKAEIGQVSRAVKTIGAESFTLAVARDGSAKIECTSPANETFVVNLENGFKFEDANQGIVHIYSGDRLTAILDLAARDLDVVPIQIGRDCGSMTLRVNGHTIIALPESMNDGDDDE